MKDHANDKNSNGATGVDGRGIPEFWRSLAERAGDVDRDPSPERELPPRAESLDLDRRDFLKLGAVSLTVAALAGCGRVPREKIVPYLDQPEILVPGEPLFFATAMPFDGYGIGLLAKSDMGRPIKLEGNPLHPASVGATGVFEQASVLDLWDPQRSRAPAQRGEPATWDEVVSVLATARARMIRDGGRGIHVLTGTVTSPTIANQMQQLLERHPQLRWHQWQPVHRDNAYEGARLAFGEPLDALYHFEHARSVLSLDADFLSCGPGNLHHARAFSAGRRHGEPGFTPNRLYMVESTASLTGAAAEHRLALAPQRVAGVARRIAARLGVAQAGDGAPEAEHAAWIEAVADDLLAQRGKALVIAGERQPPEVHVLAHAMNDALGAVGSTVQYIDPVAARPGSQTDSLRRLVDAMRAGEVAMLLMIGSNPVYSAPADLAFADALGKVALSLHLGLYFDETAARSVWHVPQNHYLETWGDVRAFDGTASVIQPLIAPLYDTHDACELLDALLGNVGRSPHDIVRARWQSLLAGSGKGFEQAWSEVLYRGVLASSAARPRQVSLRRDALRNTPSAAAATQGLALVFTPDPAVWDGAYAHNAWLQEFPKPLVRYTWDNAAQLSPATAERLHLHNEQVVRIAWRGRTVEAPVWIVPGHPDDTVSVSLGYGRRHAGEIGTGRGFNAYALRTADAPWFVTGAELHRTDRRHALATTQHHQRMHGRDIVRATGLQHFQRDPRFAHEKDIHPLESLYPKFSYPDYAWGMAINLNTCIGCGACTIACQAENNIPVVGRDQVMMGREMHWIRVDCYYRGAAADPETFFQPVPCMHCEHAPCELVCPVEASIHDSQGLNVQVYNRCVGTRFCSNNCPYKVRRFNFLDYTGRAEPSLWAQRNPEVTVRSRGVMEKCTYCLQRISVARIRASEENRRLRDGEVITACQAVCPTEAIVFGDLNLDDARVTRLKTSPLNYALLGELNTRPRTTYLAVVRNFNPALESRNHEHDG